MDDLKNSLGRAIRDARNALGWNQAVLAEKSGVEQGTISRVERGKQGVSTDVLVQIADSLGVSVSSLWLRAEGAIPAVVTKKLAANPRRSDVRDVEDEADQITTALTELITVVSGKLPGAGAALASALLRERDKATGLGQSGQVLELAVAAARKGQTQSESEAPSASPRESSSQHRRK